MEFPARPSFTAIPKPAFGKHAQHDEPTHGVFVGKAAARRMLMFKEAHELLAALPKPGESLHCIQSGFLDLCILLMAILDMHPAPCRTLRVATLCYHKRNCIELLGALESKKIGTLVVVASNFFRSHYKELHEWFGEELKAFEGCELAVARSHAKIVCIDFADDAGLVLSGSANLRSNHNKESLEITNDRPLHDWSAAFIDGLVNDAESQSEPA